MIFVLSVFKRFSTILIHIFRETDTLELSWGMI